jgi:coatomer protein complex subunit gamma
LNETTKNKTYILCIILELKPFNHTVPNIPFSFFGFKRWVNEVQEAVNNDNIMVQYHALGLLYQIHRSDKHAIRKLILKFSKAGLRSPYAYCFLVR